MRVRAGNVYKFDPCLLDLAHALTTLKKGDLVRVVNLRGCPPANTMGQCHVAHPETGAFIGMVSTASLHSRSVSLSCPAKKGATK